MTGRRFSRDLATFGINVVYFLFFPSLTLFTPYPSHSVACMKLWNGEQWAVRWKEWGNIACSCNTSSGLELHFNFQPGQRKGEDRDTKCAVAMLIIPLQYARLTSCKNTNYTRSQSHMQCKIGLEYNTNGYNI